MQHTFIARLHAQGTQNECCMSVCCAFNACVLSITSVLFKRAYRHAYMRHFARQDSSDHPVSPVERVCQLGPKVLIV